MRQRLYQKQVAFQQTAGLQHWDVLSLLTPGKLAVMLVYALETDFETQALLHRMEGETQLTLLFRNVSFTCDDFFRSYGEWVACLSARWPLTVYGTSDKLHTCELCCREENGLLRLVQQTPSGQEQEILQDMCLRLECGTERHAQAMAVLLASLSHSNTALAVSRQFEDFCREQQLAVATDGSCFCYINLEEDSRPEQFIRSLSMEQKMELWSWFLTDRVSPLEFEWLHALYRKGASVHMLEWEMALEAALEKGHFSVLHEEARFTLTDVLGQALRFDFVTGTAAEKVFLKLLFPLGGH